MVRANSSRENCSRILNAGVPKHLASTRRVTLRFKGVYYELQRSYLRKWFFTYMAMQHWSFAGHRARASVPVMKDVAVIAMATKVDVENFIF